MKIIIVFLGCSIGVCIFLLYDVTVYNITPKNYMDLYERNKNKKIIINQEKKLILCKIINIYNISYKKENILIYEQNCKDKS